MSDSYQMLENHMVLPFADDDIELGYCHCGCGEKTPLAKHTNSLIGQVKGRPMKFIHRHAANVGLSKRVRRRGWIGQTTIRGRKVVSRLYRIWRGARNRCLSKKDRAYRHYGGRGIEICEAWNHYSAFRIWAISSGYGKGLSIDRIDNDGNYEPNNCRWADAETQGQNRRTVKVDADIVKEIRGSGESSTFFRNKYGLTPKHVWAIRNRYIWRNI